MNNYEYEYDAEDEDEEENDLIVETIEEEEEEAEETTEEEDEETIIDEGDMSDDTETEDKDLYIRERKKKTLKELQQVWNFIHTYRMDLCDDNEFLLELEAMENWILSEYLHLDSSRYLSRNIYRSDPTQITHFLQKQFQRGKNAWWQPHEFKEQYRMTRTSFKKLHDMIKDHKGFQQHKNGRNQFSSKYQLLFLLQYIGTEGNGMSNRRSRNTFPNGKGTCENMKDRVVDAIIDCCDEKAYFWPDEDERKEIAHHFEKKHNIPNLVCIADGTLLPLAFKPARDDFPDFKGRKLLYTLTVMIVNDHLLRIRYYNAGWPGNVHDERVFKNCDLARHPDDYFDVMQFLIGDSAFTPRPFMVPVFKKKTGGFLSAEEERFNTILSQARILSENCIGLLKGRFPFLRSIRCRITRKKRSFKRVLRYLRVCIILHNLLIGWGDDHELTCGDDDEYLSDIDADNELNKATPPEAGGDRRRDQLFHWMMEQNIQPRPRNCSP